MQLPDGKVVVIAFVIIIAILSYFGIDLKEILQEKLSDLIPPFLNTNGSEQVILPTPYEMIPRIIGPNNK